MPCTAALIGPSASVRCASAAAINRLTRETEGPSSRAMADIVIVSSV
jgi:hypothetical protein